MIGTAAGEGCELFTLAAALFVILLSAKAPAFRHGGEEDEGSIQP
ncbi:MAG: hypothetical protein UY48_C0003G0007 [Candidatus Gottesmanbacteria bacterium GW2011_GWB1_49_7]|uniref:Uncharacterized protein n=1 Tax=Candidatus Gottesmanbacteria bacterium GW2011_GWB1_49_7 TaxID=1618448 RepID=A0A0G1W3P7_9BACT|nr:MAG: hypothetical protein UY48_C0003G0007 [Candidatus Gottesmanbacteria bacterium GW2011_GWB1_49_7]